MGAKSLVPFGMEGFCAMTFSFFDFDREGNIFILNRYGVDDFIWGWMMILRGICYFRIRSVVGFFYISDVFCVFVVCFSIFLRFKE